MRIYIFVLILTLLLGTALNAAWDFNYTCDSMPTNYIYVATPPDNEFARQFSGGYLFINDTSAARSLFQVDLYNFYPSQVRAGTMETRQEFISSSSLNNIVLMMRQDTAGASGEVRVGYYDAGDGRCGLWDVNTGRYLGHLNIEQYYKIRMILDGSSGGRLYVNDSYFSNLSAIEGAPSRIAFGANSTLGTGEVHVDYFRWKCGTMAAPGDVNDPGSSSELISPRTTSLPTVTPEQTAATITWTTDVPTDSTVHWGNTWACSSSTHSNSLVTIHSVRVEGLQLGTTYRFYVESNNGGTTAARSGIQSFTTQDTFRISTGPFVRTAANGTSATVSWNTTAASDSTLFVRQQGTTTWRQVYNQASVTRHSLGISDLTPNTNYEYYVLSHRTGSTDAQSAVTGFFTYTHSTVSSMLTNSDFELGNLVSWYNSDANVGVVYSGPLFDKIMPHSGNYFLCAQSNGGAKNGAVYQTLTDLPYDNYISATAWVCTYELSSSGTEEHNSAYCQIGIDLVQSPYDTIDPNASTIQWSAPVSTANAGPWVSVGISVPLDYASFATIFLRSVQTADGGVNVTCFDDVAVSTSSSLPSSQAAITSGPTITSTTASCATVEWTTDVDSTSFVQFGKNTTAGCRFNGYQLDLTPKKTHKAEITLDPNANYKLQVGSAATEIPMGIALSASTTLSTPLNVDLLNTSFEAKDNQGNPSLAPWTAFQYNIADLARFASSTQPVGSPINALIGPYPSGNTGWHEVTCESDGGSNFVGAFSEPRDSKNGGIYQRVKVTPGETYRASMRFLTEQDPIDPSNLADYTACAIAIDPTGGTDVLSPDLIWSQDKTSSVNGQWDNVSVTGKATGDTITVFCVIEQRNADTTRVNAIDKVTLEAIEPESSLLGRVKKNEPLGNQIAVPSAAVTYVHKPATAGQPMRIYVEDSNRSCGMGIVSTDTNLWNNPPAIGDIISIQGTLATVSLDGYPADLGEVVVNNATITRLDNPVFFVQPIALVQKYLGGTTFGTQPGVKDGNGLSTIGLLVKVVGKVTSGNSTSGWITDPSSNTCIYIDDGSRIDSGIGISGIKVIAKLSAQSTLPLLPGDMIAVTGISTVENVDGSLRPVVLLQTNDSISIIDQTR